ncbi:glycosyltransferase family 2 protein [filamentous cyanobacterium LEGE 11480]|uniref:Glycosyltransferase family 2 protein n=1 Tax=Romeriopsis navalis LEGE 11480 TaxID=2777977 RepID=A0A928VME8_9CYAN|nr:glycosyltransferase family 2 protein [Romeriopsis navalis]MBE9031288.1 glycosyltransferase family 2 protein [Romeriopsis navalis LEGE 11480]
MLGPIKVADLELSQPLPTLRGLDRYIGFKGLVRWHGAPLGYIDVPIVNGGCSAASLGQAIKSAYNWEILQQALKTGLIAPVKPDEFQFEDVLTLAPPEFEGEYPRVTVAVCTRDRVEALDDCLAAILKLDYPQLDILVIDNAPATDATRELIATYYPQVRYVKEPRPGLDWARNRAIIEAQGEIIAYTDDDVIVDAGWVKAIAKTFVEYPEVMAVTGLVVPYELETEAQVLFELNGGFGKGFERQQYYVPAGAEMPWYLLGTGNCGTGANMAYRRSIFTEIGGFNPALDVGTVTNGAGDLEMFFRVIKSGHPLVYEPQAMIRHCHRRQYAQLKSQLTNNGSVLAYCNAAVKAYPKMRLAFWRLALTWLATWHCRRVVTALMHPTQLPLDLAWAELRGWFIGLTRYRRAEKQALGVDRKFATESAAAAHQRYFPHYFGARRPVPAPPALPNCKAGAMAVRTIEVTQPLQPITDVAEYASVRVFVNYRGCGLGYVDLFNHGRPLRVSDLQRSIASQLWGKLVWPERQLTVDDRWNQVCQAIQKHVVPDSSVATAALAPRLPDHVPVSIIVGTCDRPDDLRNCLQSLSQQQTSRPVEIIVTDNHPRSGLTPPVLEEFPQVKLVSEPRKGVAYARNAAITASAGEIVVTTDDDVTMSPVWLETLLAPFARADVMGVTGNIVPVELEAFSQQLFEHYGGLGRGFETFEVGYKWFECSWLHVVPTWELGGTANAAFRASIFHQPEIGLMDEPLGPGMPSGVGEDIYLFYKILKAGYTMVYKGDAQVWHRHRQTMPALRRQLYNYSKGFVSYNLTTLFQDQDWRVLLNLGFYLPMYHFKRIYQRLRGQSAYPIRLTLVEMAGNLAGPWALWRSHKRVQREGRSAPYLPPHQRYVAPNPSVYEPQLDEYHPASRAS